jgi:hypothetical protein
LAVNKVWSFTTATAVSDAEPEPEGFPYWVIIPIIGVGAIAAILLFVKKPY